MPATHQIIRLKRMVGAGGKKSHTLQSRGARNCQTQLVLRAGGRQEEIKNDGGRCIKMVGGALSIKMVAGAGAGALTASVPLALL